MYPRSFQKTRKTDGTTQCLQRCGAPFNPNGYQPIGTPCPIDPDTTWWNLTNGSWGSMKTPSETYPAGCNIYNISNPSPAKCMDSGSCQIITETGPGNPCPYNYNMFYNSDNCKEDKLNLGLVLDS